MMNQEKMQKQSLIMYGADGSDNLKKGCKLLLILLLLALMVGLSVSCKHNASSFEQIETNFIEKHNNLAQPLLDYQGHIDETIESWYGPDTIDKIQELTDMLEQCKQLTGVTTEQVAKFELFEEEVEYLRFIAYCAENTDNLSESEKEDRVADLILICGFVDVTSD